MKMKIRSETVIKWLCGFSIYIGITIVDVSASTVGNVDNAGALVDLTKTVQLVREQVNALVNHRQQDYNALEESLKNAMEKNTELTVLRNQVRQLRKEVNNLGGGSGNEAKNERLRVKWLGSAVTELRTEIAEVLRTRNTSEEIDQRSLMQSEIALLKGDVAEVGRGIRDLGGRLTKIEAALGTIRLDIFAIKERTGQLTRTCADVTSQLSTVQIEMKSMKCGSTTKTSSPPALENNAVSSSDSVISDNRVNGDVYEHDEKLRSKESKEFVSSRNDRTNDEKLMELRYMSSVETDERLKKLEHKIAIVARKRGILEKRVVYERDNEFRTKLVELEINEMETERKLSEMSREVAAGMGKIDQSIIRLFESVENISDVMEKNKSEEKRELGKLEMTAARKYGELSMAREELVNLRRTVQALSVSASKLQEKSDMQQDRLASLQNTVDNVTKLGKLEIAVDRATIITKQLERVEDDYRSMVESLPGNCDDRDGLTLLAAGSMTSGPLLVSCRRGWIVVGRRIDGIIDFDRSWRDYAEGFGSAVNEFWIGNEALHRLTRDENCTSLVIDLTDIYGTGWQARYENFYVASEDTGYRLSVSGYSGNATDAMSYQNGMSFSAKDRDMDISSADCAANYRGGWWFSHCQHANLNGRYNSGLAWYRSDTNQWMTVASSVMSIQRKPRCSDRADTRLLSIE